MINTLWENLLIAKHKISNMVFAFSTTRLISCVLWKADFLSLLPRCAWRSTSFLFTIVFVYIINLCWRWETRNLFCWSHTQTLTPVASEAIHTRTSVTSDGVGTCGVGMTAVSAFFTLIHIWRHSRKKKCSYIRQLVTEKKLLVRILLFWGALFEQDWCCHS